MNLIPIGLICFASLCLPSFNPFKWWNDIPREQQLVNELLSKGADSLRDKHKMCPIGTFIAMPENCVRELGLHFQIQGPRTKEDLRRIIVDGAQDLLARINAQEELRPYLNQYPFEIGNIDMALFVINKDGRGMNDPDVRIVSLYKVKDRVIIKYTTYVEEFTVKSDVKETYEEALKLLNP